LFSHKKKKGTEKLQKKGTVQSRKEERGMNLCAIKNTGEMIKKGGNVEQSSIKKGVPRQLGPVPKKGNRLDKDGYYRENSDPKEGLRTIRQRPKRREVEGGDKGSCGMATN